MLNGLSVICCLFHKLHVDFLAKLQEFQVQFILVRYLLKSIYGKLKTFMKNI